jgi:hypothetical protein
MYPQTSLLLLLGAAVMGIVVSSTDNDNISEEQQHRDYLNEWAVHIPSGHSIADRVAADLGFENVGQVSKNITSGKCPDTCPGHLVLFSRTGLYGTNL